MQSAVGVTSKHAEKEHGIVAVPAHTAGSFLPGLNEAAQTATSGRVPGKTTAPVPAACLSRNITGLLRSTRQGSRAQLGLGDSQ